MKLVIIGAGGHARVVAESAMEAGWDIVGFLDDAKHPQLYDLQYLGKLEEFHIPTGVHAVIAIGSNRTREKIATRFTGQVQWATIIHPKAICSPRSNIEEGSVVLAGAVIQAQAQVGKHCIVNTAASVDHDCEIGSYCHIAPHATLTGGVALETGVFVGAGAVIIPYKSIGAWSILGAGSVCTKNLEADQTYVGTPAQALIRF